MIQLTMVAGWLLAMTLGAQTGQGEPEPEPHAWLEIPMVDPAGQPVAHREFSVHRRENDPAFRFSIIVEHDMRLTTNAAGILRVPVDSSDGTVAIGIPRQPDRFVLTGVVPEKPVFRGTTLGSPVPPDPVLAKLEYSTVDGGGFERLEAVVAPIEKILFAGIVLRPDGSPAVGAKVRIAARSTDVLTRTEAARVHAITDRAGRFSFKGFGVEGEFEVVAFEETSIYKRTAVSVPVRAQPGERSLRLEVHPHGELGVSLKAGVPNVQIELEILPIETDAVRAALLELIPEEKTYWYPRCDLVTGEARLPLLPGTYRVRAYQGHNRILDVDQVVIRGGEVTTDPRLRTEVGGNLVLRKIQVHNADGTASKALLQIIEPSWRARHSAMHTDFRADEAGQVEVVLPRDARPWIKAYTYEPGHSWHGFADAWPLTVRLAPNRPASIRLVGAERLKGMVWRSFITAMPFDGDNPPKTPMVDYGRGPEFVPSTTLMIDRGDTVTYRSAPQRKARVWLAIVREQPKHTNWKREWIELGDVDFRNAGPWEFELTAEHEAEIRK